MKLWWTHNETLIAFLMAYQHTKEEQLIDKFAQVFDYCYAKVLPDTNNLIVRVFSGPFVSWMMDCMLTLGL